MTTKRTLISISFLIGGIVIGMLVEKSTYEEFFLSENPGTKWSEEFKQIEIPSPLDNKKQQAYFFAAPSDKPQPLIVSLHTWSFDYNQSDTLAVMSKAKGIHYIHPDFRGKNNSPEACCSDQVLSDLDAAIDYAIAHANVDTSRIYVTGRSGGGYATICMFMKSRHKIKKFSAWVPLTDLVQWYDETRSRKLKYADEILACTNSKNGVLNAEEATRRSPMRWPVPASKLSYASLHIYAGVNDGLEGNGPIPITQSINFYNKVLRESGASDSSRYVSNMEKLKLLEWRKPLADYGKIEARDVCLRKEWNHVAVTIFSGGHEMLWQAAFDDLLSD